MDELLGFASAASEMEEANAAVKETMQILGEALSPGGGIHIGDVPSMARDVVADLQQMRKALERIERWFGEFPPTGHTWKDGSTMSYGAAYGSNGERDYMRAVARQALNALAPSDSERKTDA
ncbi:MAG: hypothetical protein EPO20_14745 [Betaproteobacteria bacterium]|nr:MAG: hypothetical protein EPO20_14745 [Betaproteobacteria bacterium]